MRIVGGEFRGRTLAGPKSDAIRPTSDRARESLFNIIAHSWPQALNGARVLDLFAGTGAVGIEAISRGARAALFVDIGAEARALLRTNIEALGLEGRTKIFRRDAATIGHVGTIEPFDLVFADPPYGRGLGEKALSAAAAGGWLRAGALAILEERAGAAIGPLASYSLIESRRFGDTEIRFFRYRAGDTDPAADEA